MNKEYHKEYYKNNKDKLSEYYSKKIECICGKIVNRGSYNYHRKSKLHINTLNHKIENENIKQKLNLTSI